MLFIHGFMVPLNGTTVNIKIEGSLVPSAVIAPAGLLISLKHRHGQKKNVVRRLIGSEKEKLVQRCRIQPRERPSLFYKPGRSLRLLLGLASRMPENAVYFCWFLNYRYQLHFGSTFRAGHSLRSFALASWGRP